MEKGVRERERERMSKNPPRVFHKENSSQNH